MNERNPAAPGLGRKSRRRLGVDGERNGFFAFGAIDVGIGGRVDDRAPRLRRDHPRDRTRIFQIELSSTWRDHLDILGQGQRAKLLADLAGPAKKEKAHRVTRSSWRGRGGSPASCADNSGSHQARFSRYHFTVAMQAGLKGVLRRPAELAR